MTRQILTSALLALFLLATSAGAADRPELEIESAMDAHSDLELSGILQTAGGYWAVSDNAEDHFIYLLTIGKKGKGYRLIPTLDLTKLKGFNTVQDAFLAELRVDKKHRRLDLEGITGCGDLLYVANERVRQVLIIDTKAKTIAKAPIDFSSYADLFKGEANAGFEGVAADCASQKLFVAKEREPRRIITVDMRTWAVVADHDIGVSDRGGQMIINPFNGGNGLMTINPDFADLTFDQGYLYVLERNTYEVTKVDPKTFEVVARVSYFNAEHNLYETGDPYPQAEALSLSKDKIVVGIDHNGTPFTAAANKTFGFKGKAGSMFIFKRPAGF